MADGIWILIFTGVDISAEITHYFTTYSCLCISFYKLGIPELFVILYDSWRFYRKILTESNFIFLSFFFYICVKVSQRKRDYYQTIQFKQLEPYDMLGFRVFCLVWFVCFFVLFGLAWFYFFIYLFG